ncbi:MAG: IS3 family transposase [Ilumatobacter sp.]|nr:IS3 family transposase [Ilumatobacter sp.]
MSLYRLIRAEGASTSIRQLCGWLRVARSAYHAWEGQQGRSKGVPKVVSRVQPANTDATPRRSLDRINDACLMVHIRAAFKRARGAYGARRITRAVSAELGFAVNIKRVRRLMASEGLAGKPKRRFKVTTTRGERERNVAPNLLERQFQPDQPNTSWAGDITYIRVNGGFVYLAVLIDLFSKRVVGWSLQANMKTELCLDALTMAVQVRRPDRGLVHHTDRGSQYCSDAYHKVIRTYGIAPSMSRVGNCWDNAAAESFFGTLKQEVIHDTPLANLAEAQDVVANYIMDFYNTERLHSANGYLSPAEYEDRYYAQSAKAA